MDKQSLFKEAGEEVAELTGTLARSMIAALPGGIEASICKQMSRATEICLSHIAHRFDLSGNQARKNSDSFSMSFLMEIHDDEDAAQNLIDSCRSAHDESLIAPKPEKVSGGDSDGNEETGGASFSGSVVDLSDVDDDLRDNPKMN